MEKLLLLCNHTFAAHAVTHVLLLTTWLHVGSAKGKPIMMRCLNDFAAVAWQDMLADVSYEGTFNIKFNNVIHVVPYVIDLMLDECADAGTEALMDSLTPTTSEMADDDSGVAGVNESMRASVSVSAFSSSTKSVTYGNMHNGVDLDMLQLICNS